MNAGSYDNWKKVYQDFLKESRSKEDYCREKGLELNWFKRQCRKADAYEKLLAARKEKENQMPDNLQNLFVELIPEKGQAEPEKSRILKLNYRGVAFELPHNFAAATFKHALQIIREVL